VKFGHKQKVIGAHVDPPKVKFFERLYFGSFSPRVMCKGNTLKFGIEQRWGRENWRFSTNKPPYVRNGEIGPTFVEE